jgi:hypothetical protein
MAKMILGNPDLPPIKNFQSDLVCPPNRKERRDMLLNRSIGLREQGTLRAARPRDLPKDFDPRKDLKFHHIIIKIYEFSMATSESNFKEMNHLYGELAFQNTFLYLLRQEPFDKGIYPFFKQTYPDSLRTILPRLDPIEVIYLLRCIKGPCRDERGALTDKGMIVEHLTRLYDKYEYTEFYNHLWRFDREEEREVYSFVYKNRYGTEPPNNHCAAVVGATQ